MDRFIVLEISRNWTGPDRGLLAEHPTALLSQGMICQQFQAEINVKARDGYRLHSFQLHRLMVDRRAMNETLVAVFEKEGWPGHG